VNVRLGVLFPVALFVAPVLHAQDYAVVFEGRPLIKVESSFESTESSSLDSDEAFEFAVRIVERRGKYYWATREMRELVRSESGAYITFHAVDGSGYVRVGAPLLLELRDLLPADKRRREIGYVEHLLIQYASVTYYGNRSGAP
jgi:hypothetical protein